MKTISPSRLRWLRNKIPITHLIQELTVPSKVQEGVFRFLCPLCNEFNTATNATTNLARCFRCERNFNPIDLAMEVKGLRFLDAVRFLEHFAERKRRIVADSGRR
jgi:hypothetical protein